MATTNTDAFPVNDTEYSVVDPAVNSSFTKFDYKDQEAQNDDQLKVHGVNLDEVQKQASTGQVDYRRPECIDDPLSSSMATYRWKNASDPAVHDYAALFHLKRWLATGIDTAINMWCASKKKEKSRAVPEYKVGVEVKALFKKNHIDLLNPNPEAEALKEKRVMFINKVLEKVISGEPSLKDREDIGSLISAVEWQCFDENHNRDSAHVLHNIIEFRVNIYAAQKMRPGGSWFPLPKRIQDTKAVINPKNKDDRCFLYAVYLGLLDLST